MKEIEEILDSVDTPAFVYSAERLDDSLARVRSVLEGLWAGNWIAYSYKTNPVLARYLAQRGCAMQVTSPIHLREVLQFLSKDEVSNSFYCSGSMTKDDALEVVRSGMYVVVDSQSQFNCVNQAAKEVGTQARVLIRVDAGQSTVDSPFGTSGLLQGVDIEDVADFFALANDNIRIAGIHNHFGSQITSLDSWASNIRAIGSKLRELNQPLEILNIGGGTPISYHDVEAPDIQTIYRECLMDTLQSIRDSHPGLRIVVEPGRYLVGPCGFLVATATNLHQSEDRQGANLDASLFASFPDRFLSSLTFQFPVVSPAESSGWARDTILRGSSPASIDYFGIYPGLPDVKLGDRVVFGMAGAYASAMGSGFSGVMAPSEYLLTENKLERIQ